MEIRDLYNKNRVFLNRTIVKGDKVPEDCYYLVVFAIIESNGKYLIQKRSKEKGGKWAFTAGHPISGENSLEGLIRETKEELNLDIKNENIKLIKTIVDDIHIIDIYHINMDIDCDKIILQKEEVDDYKMVSSDDINVLIENNLFLKEHKDRYLELKNDQKINLFK